jgi:hypothetical protein
MFPGVADCAGKPPICVSKRPSAGNAQRRKELAAEIRRRFHEVLFKQETIRADRGLDAAFRRVEGIVDKLARSRRSLRL